MSEERKVGEAERKGVQLCNLAGAMMTACKRLRSLQQEHARLADANKRASHGRLYKGGMKCACETCSIPLPDLSDEAIGKLVEESNARAAVLDAAVAWAKADAEWTPGSGTASARRCDEALAALRSAVKEYVKGS